MYRYIQLPRYNFFLETFVIPKHFPLYTSFYARVDSRNIGLETSVISKTDLKFLVSGIMFCIAEKNNA